MLVGHTDGKPLIKVSVADPERFLGVMLMPGNGPAEGSGLMVLRSLSGPLKGIQSSGCKGACLHTGTRRSLKAYSSPSIPVPPPLLKFI